MATWASATHSPATAEWLADVADDSGEHVDTAVTAALAGIEVWREVPPLNRAPILREVTAIIPRNGDELPTIDVAEGGDPVKEVSHYGQVAAVSFESFAGFVTKMTDVGSDSECRAGSRVQ